MYFSKTCWLLIVFIYRFKKINNNYLFLLRNDLSSYIPKIFFFLPFIFVYTGKVTKSIKLKKTLSLLKNFK